ncbi:hypothetical protein R1flu_013497 [Riccia fluitans]|uniref:Uncharacterized protein n=1 Tax=Riccia fluitans TaxID=41844 RepID=A0ABD1YDF5_9MARC
MAVQNQLYKKMGRMNPFMPYGMPMITFIVKEVVNAREDQEWAAIAAQRSLTQEGPLADFKLKKKKHIDLEEELKAFQKKVDINAFKYKAVPKPRWEE